MSNNNARKAKKKSDEMHRGTSAVEKGIRREDRACRMTRFKKEVICVYSQHLERP